MAGTNPLIAQGVLNRLRGSAIWPDNPSLNVTAPFLGKEGIRLALEGGTVVYMPTMTGAVRSLQPFMMISATVHLLKTQQLSDLYKQKMEDDSALGDGTIRTDAKTLSVYPVVNCSIVDVRELSFAGEDPVFGVVIRGYYLVNSSMWDLG